jgi:hypothetical protein
MSSKYWDEALFQVHIHLTRFAGKQNIFETKMHTMKPKYSAGRKNVPTNGISQRLRS